MMIKADKARINLVTLTSLSLSDSMVCLSII